MECGGRASRDSAKRRHRFGRFTTVIVRASLKAVSPVAIAPFVLLPARCAGTRSEAPLRFAPGPRLRRDHLRAGALRATALQKIAAPCNGKSSSLFSYAALNAPELATGIVNRPRFFRRKGGKVKWHVIRAHGIFPRSSCTRPPRRQWRCHRRKSRVRADRVWRKIPPAPRPAPP